MSVARGSGCFGFHLVRVTVGGTSGAVSEQPDPMSSYSSAESDSYAG